MSLKIIIPLILFILTTMYLLIRCVDCPPNTFEERFIKLKAEMTDLGPTLHGSLFSLNPPNAPLLVAGQGVTDSTLFYIGSVSKQMTAYMALKLLKVKNPEKDLNVLIQQPLTEVFPGSVLLKKIKRSWPEKVTLLDLLGHTSGLQDYVDYYTSEKHLPAQLNRPLDPVQLLSEVTFDESKSHVYSNTNYYLLSKLLEEDQEKSYAKLFNENIKIPAELKDSEAPSFGNYAHLKKQFAQLAPNENKKVFIDFANVLGAGGVLSSARDLHKWNHFLYENSPSDIQSILFKAYHKSPEGDVDLMALSLQKTAVGDLIGYQGSLDSYSCFLGWLPQSKTSVVILAATAFDFERIRSRLTSLLGVVAHMG